MVKIPPPSATDSDDVAWAIQTATTLLERGDVEDAVVWLRRGAQAAAQAEDDTRALELARVAAELAEPVASAGDADGSDQPPVSIELDPLSIRQGGSLARSPSAQAPPPPPIRPAPTPASFDDDEVVTSAPPMEQIAILRALAKSSSPAVVAPPAGLPPPPQVKADKPTPLAPIPVVVIAGRDVADPTMSPEARLAPDRAAPKVVPLGEEPTQPSLDRPPEPPCGAPFVPASAALDEEPTDLSSTEPLAAPAPSAVPNDEPTIPCAEQTLPEAPDLALPGELAPSRVLESQPLAVPQASNPSISSKAPPPPAVAKASPQPPRVDLSSVEPFVDMPAETREAFQRSATRHALRNGEEVSGFGLAVLTDGEAIVAAIVNDVAAVQLKTGALLRSRGSVDDRIALRLVCASEQATIMTWSEEDVAQHLDALPWVEDELRSEADRVHVAVGMTLGPLGQAFDAAMLQEVAKRLDVRQLLPGEVLVNAGEVLPGLVVLGVGEIEVEGQAGLTIGDLLFPSALLNAAAVPATVRAGPRGAVVLWTELSKAQELLMVFPPLLDLITRS